MQRVWLLTGFFALALAQAFALPAAFGKDSDRERREAEFERQRQLQRRAEADRYRADADNAYQKADFRRVIDAANHLIQSYPDDNVHVAYHFRASARIELGRAAGSARDVREGISDARQALAVGANRFPYLYIPYLYGLSSLAEIENRPEHADLAIKVVTPVIARPLSKDYTADDKANLLYQRGLSYAAKQEYKLAAADLDEAVSLSPKHLSALLKRGHLHYFAGQQAEARKAYDDAVNAYPNEVITYNDRGSFLRNIGDLDGAVIDFTRALQINPKFAIGYINRGMSLADQNSAAAAEGDYTEALKLELDPATKALAYRMRGSARLAGGHARGAVADFSAALKFNLRDAAVLEERGVAYFCLADYVNAAADLNKALELSPESPHAAPWLFIATARAGQQEAAGTTLENLFSGKTPPAGWTASLANFLLGKIGESELLAAAERTNREQTCEAHFFIGQKQLLAGESESAAERLQACLKTGAFHLSAHRAARFASGEFKIN
jgi:tetratricopeptide (TPR) repeat protein